MDEIRIGVVLASVREGRRGEAFARSIRGLMAAREGVDAKLLDLREWALGPYDVKDSPMVAEKAYAPGTLARRWFDEISALDGLLVVTPEYSHGYPGQRKNALDHLYVPYNYKPIAFLSYGGFAGGARAGEQLRLLAVEIRMVPIRDEVNVRLVGYWADENGAPKDPLYGNRAGVMIDELSWWARLLRTARPR